MGDIGKVRQMFNFDYRIINGWLKIRGNSVGNEYSDLKAFPFTLFLVSHSPYHDRKNVNQLTRQFEDYDCHRYGVGDTTTEGSTSDYCIHSWKYVK